MEDHAGEGPQRPRHLAEHARSRDQLDLDGVMLDEPEGTFELQTAQRIVDDLRTLKAAAAMDKGVGLDGCTAKPATRGLLGGRLHVVLGSIGSGMTGVGR